MCITLYSRNWNKVEDKIIASRHWLASAAKFAPFTRALPVCYMHEWNCYFLATRVHWAAKLGTGTTTASSNFYAWTRKILISFAETFRLMSSMLQCIKGCNTFGGRKYWWAEILMASWCIISLIVQFQSCHLIILELWQNSRSVICMTVLSWQPENSLVEYLVNAIWSKSIWFWLILLVRLVG